MTTTTVSVRKETPVLIVAVLLALAGIGAWIYQLAAGMQVTGLSSQIVWGVYIASFFTAVGAGAGLLALTGLSEYVDLFPAAQRGRNLCLAIACFICGAFLIVMDVGNPLSVWRIMSAFKFSSLMTWDFWLLVAAGVIALVYLLSVRSKQDQKALGLLGILAGVSVVVVEAWMLTTQAAHPLWGTGVIVVSFLVGAVIAGLSIMLIAKTGGEAGRKLLKAALSLGLALVLIEILTSLLGKGEETRMIVAGFAAPVFWFQVIFGLILPIFMLARDILPWLAGVLAIWGVAAEKVWMLAAGSAIPWMPEAPAVYNPNWVEFLAVIGVAALGVLIYRVMILIFKPEA